MKLAPRLYALTIIVEIAWLSQLYSHDPPKPTDPVSIGLGWGAVASMSLMLVYSVARRSAVLRRAVPLGHWLSFHIFLGVQGVLFAIAHSSHIFLSSRPLHILNPAIINFVAVLVVFASGCYGRFLYAQLPRRISGEQMAADESRAEIDRLVPALASRLPPARGDHLAAPGLVGLWRRSREVQRVLREVGRLEVDSETREQLRRYVRLSIRVGALASTERLFRHWIVLHRPLATVMYILTALHIVLALTFTAI